MCVSHHIFSCIGISFEDSSIFWSTSNVDIVDVNSKSGVAVAKSPGTCTIFANHGEFTTQIEVCFLLLSRFHWYVIALQYYL